MDIDEIAKRHGFSRAAAGEALRGVVAGRGTMAQFDHRELGGAGQWMRGGMIMLADMANDAVAVLDAVGAERAHVMGLSMGGMIVQRLAIDHPERLLSMTSVMSRTGEEDYGQSAPEALALLMAPPATSRDEYVENHLKALRIYG